MMMVELLSYYPKLRPAFKKKWLAALRSGEYAQGTEYLCNVGKKYDRFCCLGVACDILAPGKWEEAYDGGGALSMNDEVGVPPTKILDKMFSAKGPDADLVINNLVKMNDDGKKFKTIANWIERNL